MAVFDSGSFAAFARFPRKEKRKDFDELDHWKQGFTEGWEAAVDRYISINRSKELDNDNAKGKDDFR
jgi:hypothetical protein